jgi:DNA polymerase I-like protein with 3'-5' exonuclease and polymerase domains
MTLTYEDILSCAGKPLAIDTETTGLSWHKDGLIGIGIHCPKADVSGYAHTCSYEEDYYGKPKKKEVWKGEKDYSKSTRGRKVLEEYFEPDKAIYAIPQPTRAKHFLQAVQEISQDPDTVLIGHNLKFDAHFLGLRLWEAPCKILDTAVLVHLIDSRLGKSLANAEAEFLGTDSKRDHVSKADKRFLKSPWMWGEKVLEDYCTNDCIVTYQLAETLMPQIREMDLTRLLTLQMKYLRLLQKIEWRGIKVEDSFCHQAIKEFEKNIYSLEQELYDVIGYEFNWRSSQQLSKALYDHLGIKKPTNPYPVGSRNAGAKMYTNSATGTPLLLLTKHPAHKEVIVLRETAKLKEYAQKYLDLKDKEGAIHASFNIHGTVTGRLSCVSGDTLLPTSRGIFRFDEYLPHIGDLVPTHTGSWKSVLRKIFKGYSPMLSVYLTDGNVLKCTKDHKVLTPNGWQRIENLSVGDEVYSYGNIKELYTESKEYRGCSGYVFEQLRETDNQANSRAIRSDLSQRNGNYQYERRGRKIESRASSSLLQIEAIRQECYARENGRKPSQLQRSDIRWTWLFNEEGQWEIRPRASQSICRISGNRGNSFRNGSSPYRRGPYQQRHQQPCPSDRLWSQAITSKITKIEDLGTMGVWDIEVAGDHSYLSQGFLNHNSSEPNLQQLASKHRKYDIDSPYTGGTERVGAYNLRQALRARPGYKIISIDHKQQEVRLLAILSQEPILLQYMEQRKDIHLSIALKIWGDQGEKQNKIHRDWSKGIVFALTYGMQESSLQEHFDKLGISADAVYVKKMLFDNFPGLYPWFEKVDAQIEQDGCIRYWSGRYWYPDFPTEGYKGINAIIQGGAGDFLSLVLVRANQILEAQDWGYLISIIHDEALYEIREECVAEAAPVLSRVMEGEDVFGYPFLTDIEVGDSYGTLEPFETAVDISKIDWKEYIQERAVA